MCAALQILDNGDILYKSQIQLFEPREPTAEFGCITEVYSLLQEKRGDLAQGFCCFDTICESTKFRGVDWSNAGGCCGTSVIRFMVGCGVVCWDVSYRVANFCS
jgi:hypothetical protein